MVNAVGRNRSGRWEGHLWTGREGDRREGERWEKGKGGEGKGGRRERRERGKEGEREKEGREFEDCSRSLGTLHGSVKLVVTPGTLDIACYVPVRSLSNGVPRSSLCN